VTVVYNLTVRNNRLTQVVNAIDGAGTSGFLRLLDSGGNVISSLQLSRPCGIISGGVLTFSGMSLIDPAATGSSYAVGARIEDGNANIIVSSLTVGTGSTSDIVMSPTNFITAGQAVAITTASIVWN
jgi:hypothetical protein